MLIIALNALDPAALVSHGRRAAPPVEHLP